MRPNELGRCGGAAVALVLALSSSALAASPVGTAFTYQGRLNRSGAAATDTCQFIFILYDAAAAGTQVGPTLTYDGQGAHPAPIAVTAGLFTAALDFGPGVFTSDARWLDVQVKCTGDASYTSLGRQKITPAPYSLSAPALQGRAVSTTAPTSGQVLQWNSVTSMWEPATVVAPPPSFDNGCPGPRVRGVCVTSWNSTQVTGFLAAALACSNQSADLCTDSQAWQLGVGYWQNIYVQEAVLWSPRWTASFSDNDAASWTGANGGTGDNNNPNSSFGYACCGGTTPANARLPVQTFNGVKVTYVHNVADTYFSGAVGTCAALNSDVCSDSQTLLLRDNGRLTVPTWTNSHSDNDGGSYNAINGGTADDPAPSNLYGFACCPSLAPSDLGCPVARIGGVCAPLVHNSADADFRAAATACASTGYDLCSIAQEAILRTFGQLTVPTWSNSHSDNDAGNASAGVGGVPDNPVLTTSYGYACCVK
jgi:hypothetical protein